MERENTLYVEESSAAVSYKLNASQATVGYCGTDVQITIKEFEDSGDITYTKTSRTAGTGATVSPTGLVSGTTQPWNVVVTITREKSDTVPAAEEKLTVIFTNATSKSTIGTFTFTAVGSTTKGVKDGVNHFKYFDMTGGAVLAGYTANGQTFEITPSQQLDEKNTTTGWAEAETEAQLQKTTKNCLLSDNFKFYVKIGGSCDVTVTWTENEVYTENTETLTLSAVKSTSEAKLPAEPR